MVPVHESQEEIAKAMNRLKPIRRDGTHSGKRRQQKSTEKLGEDSCKYCKEDFVSISPASRPSQSGF